MHGLFDIYLNVIMACGFVAFIIELILNRRPFLVAFAVPFLLFLLFVLRMISDGDQLDGTVLMIFGGMFAIGGLIASLIGSGIARALRMWMELRHEDGPSDQRET